MNKPKFAIGDIVVFYDDHSFNPANDVYSVGRIEAIHIFHGSEIGYYPGRGETKPKSLKGRITYTISGSSLIREEAELNKWEG